MFNQFFFAKNLATGEVCCFATKYIPCGQRRGSRLAWWEINAGCERIGPRKTRDWNNGVTNRHEEQLAEVLGVHWKVYAFHETLKLHSK